jgi:predicted acyltransferase
MKKNMETAKLDRLVSLDVFRGITIMGMILVNNPGSWGSIYPALEHASWNGVTPTDYIFPFFLFIVGVAITLSLTKRKERGDDQKKLILQIFRRAIMIFLIGMVLQGFPYFNLSTIRIPGVLQRIAVVYFFASFIFIKSNWKTQAYIAGGLLIFYWIIMTAIPVPGYGTPNLYIPVIMDANGNPLFAPNLAGWLDNLLLPGHLWKSTKVWDPEGLLSTIPAISTALSGVLLGAWLRTNNDKTTKIVWMFIFGSLGIVLATIIDMWFPINKSLWTSSYVLFNSGMALHFFALCYWFIDVKGITWWTKPFVVYGTNAIAVFFLSGIGARLMNLIKVTNDVGIEVSLQNFLFDKFFLSWLVPIHASLAWALMYVVLWLGLMWILYAKKIFIKV